MSLDDLSAAPEAAAVAPELGWPAPTVALLHQAFQAGCNRTTGFWDHTGQEPSAVAVAARYFRRGVAYRQGEDPPATPIAADGEWVVTFQPARGPHDPPPPWPTDSFVIADAGVAAAWRDRLPRAPDLVLELTEANKSLATVAQILDAARQHDRTGPWRVVGGGLLLDVATFAAALAARPVVLIPTTLLAMVDASIGGKCGVNFPPFGKNQLGCFYFPEMVEIWTGWLATLSDRQLSAGATEGLKHAFLAGDADLARNLADAVSDRHLGRLSELVPLLLEFKARLVEEDAGEAGRRAVLNFGHTMGHAFEALSQASATGDDILLHGEAVALGLIFAIVLSQRVAELPASAATTMIDLLRRSACVPSLADLHAALGDRDLRSPTLFADLLELIRQDKKRQGSPKTTDWVVLDAPGRVARESRTSWTVAVFDGEVEAAFKTFLRNLGA